MKLCVDCKHAKVEDYSVLRCTHPLLSTQELVYGIRFFPTASETRYIGNCGLEAKLFEPKVSWWKEIFK
jgi:hypothetical protein